MDSLSAWLHLTVTVRWRRAWYAAWRHTTALRWLHRPSLSWRSCDRRPAAGNASVWSRRHAESRVASAAGRQPGLPVVWLCSVFARSANPSSTSHRSASRTRTPPPLRGPATLSCNTGSFPAIFRGSNNTICAWSYNTFATHLQHSPFPATLRGPATTSSRFPRYAHSSRAAARKRDVSAGSAAESPSSASYWPRWSNADARHQWHLAP